LNHGTYNQDNQIFFHSKKKPLMPISELKLEGQHNVKNAMAAATVANLLRVRKQFIRESLQNFHGVEHRMEQVLKINKVQYINDSKATNVNATYYALQSMKSPTVWIVGGLDKGNDYTELFPIVFEKVKAIVCLGVDNKKIVESFGSIVKVISDTQCMTEAVRMAYQFAEPGDSVLLSPACASFDLFEDYEDRGRQFKDAVRQL
jgi:UDP-N-acetylmuramoylalanine--D-glutamate ligase